MPRSGELPRQGVPALTPWLVGGCTLVGLFEMARLYLHAHLQGAPESWWRSFLAAAPFWVTLGFFLALLAPLARRFPMERDGWRRSLVMHLGMGLAFAAFHTALAQSIIQVLLHGVHVPVLPLRRLISPTLLFDFFCYLVLVATVSALDYQRRYFEEERAAARLAARASDLEASLSRARLEALRMQLNPHFLFNTLNATSVLALKGETDKVVAMLSRLSDLLRIVLEGSRQVAPLAEELDLLERYLEIEKVRFEDRLTVLVEAEPAALGAEVPSLVLQPLAENAVRHGISRQPGPGRLEVRVRTSGDRLRIEVQDSGPGFAGADGGDRGVGLANTRERLEQLYGDRASLELLDAPGGGGLVRLTLPLRREDDLG